MRIKRIRVVNLFSFRRAQFSFEDYNIIVGKNGSGKSNLLRVLEMLRIGQESRDWNTLIGIERLPLPETTRLDANLPSSITLECVFSEQEIQAVLMLITHSPIDPPFHDHVKNITIEIRWKDSLLDGESPSYVAMTLGNGMSLFRTPVSNDFLFYEKYSGERIIQLKSEHAITTIRRADLKLRDYQGGVPDSSKYWESLKGKDFQSAVRNGSTVKNFFIVNKKPICLERGIVAQTDDVNQRGYSPKVFKIAGIPFESRAYLSIWLLLGRLFWRHIAIHRANRLNSIELAKKIEEFSKSPENRWRYEQISEKFSELFCNVKFAVMRKDDITATGGKGEEYFIQVSEGESLPRPIDSSSSGYLEGLSIFADIASNDDNVLLLDEPALNLHPSKIRYLSRMLSSLAKRQIIIITHSPFFVDTDLFNAGRSLIFLRKNKENISEVHQMPKNMQIDIPSHVFNPEIFFSNFCIFVEGASDVACFEAISDYNDKELLKHDIVVIDMHGKDTTEHYHKIASKYKIPFIIMVDKEYGKKLTNVTKLPGRLENELAKMGWKKNLNSSKSIKPIDAYYFVFNKLQKNPTAATQTIMWEIYKKALVDSQTSTTTSRTTSRF